MVMTVDTVTAVADLERGVRARKFLGCHAHFRSRWQSEHLEATLGLVKCLEIRIRECVTMPGCCCCMPLLYNYLMDLCSYVLKNTPLPPLNPPLYQLCLSETCQSIWACSVPWHGWLQYMHTYFEKSFMVNVGNKIFTLYEYMCMYK